MSQSKRFDFEAKDKKRSSQPASTQEIYDRATAPTDDDEFLEHINFGLGNYSRRESYQQVELYLFGLYGQSAFGRTLRKMVEQKVKFKLGIYGWQHVTEDGVRREHEGWQSLDDAEQELEDRESYATGRGADIWELLPNKEREQAMKQFADTDPEWTPPQHSAAMAHHEVSRARGARLMDNLFGRVSVQKLTEAAEKGKSKLLSLGD